MKKSTRIQVLFARIKLVISLLLMALMAYVFTFYLDSDIGVVVCAFLVIAPLLSVLLTWSAAWHITAQLKAPDTLTKGRHFSAVVTVQTNSKLPVPFLRVGLQQDANFTLDDPRPVQSAMTAAEPLKIEIGMTAQYAGNGMLSVGQLLVSDYLGLVTFSVRSVPAPLQIGVIPAVPSLTGAALLLHSISDAVLTQDEEEEESAATFSAQTQPGYVHRDYVPGDNLRRVNWKLSAKRNKLMVRMDEAASATRPAVILDLRPEETPERLKRRETLMEGALGLLLLLVQQGIACTLRFAADGVWKCLLLENEDAVRTAAIELASADFRNDGSRLDPSAMQEHSFLIYSSDPDDSLSAALRQVHDNGYVTLVFPVFPELPTISGTDAMWQLSEDFSMTAVQK